MGWGTSEFIYNDVRLISVCLLALYQWSYIMAHILSNHTRIIALIKSGQKKWAGNVARMGERRNAHMVLAVNPVEKRPLGRSGRRWEDNITRQTMYKRVQRNIEVPSCNHCCSGKGISITYSECVYVALGSQHVMRMRHTVIYGMTVYTIFFHVVP